MHVFVPVQVRRLDPGVADFLDLRVPFAFDFIQQQSATRAPQEQSLGSAREFGFVIQQARYRFRLRDRRAVAQVQVHAHAQTGRGPCSLHTVRKRRSVRQQRRAGHNPVMKRLHDSAVYPARPPQIICVDDQIPHDLSCSGVPTCPFVQLLFRVPTGARTIDAFHPQL